ncbi:MAG: hypothetical protein GWN84_18255 [Gammaproteobacteria bacterium]|nr:hypothetical protein [Gammaproteobacteria bacterium]NIR84775.1 hypothetical protein [Gammaproteobacteria bacterium]NIR91294.1 hypothetical protein [Gammaproteobacteria bacterium]NIU05822.1 hypothetical protein [Gammaproteobacteria bacterium]NIV76482.1 hypothetical protein [Gammaproteobacteria bacterium]
MRRSGIALSVAGVLTLAAHLLHVQFLSGTELARYRVMSGPGSWVDAADGFVGAAERAALHHAGPFALDPGMNPVRAVLEVRRGSAAPAAGSVIYGARLLDERGATVWTGSGVHHGQDDGGGAPGSSVSVHLDPFEVESAGRYVLLLDPGESGSVGLRSGANIILRRNVAQARAGFVVAGLIAFVLGVALLLSAGRGRRRPAAEQPGAE